jgi:hypothetical protein
MLMVELDIKLDESFWYGFGLDDNHEKTPSAAIAVTGAGRENWTIEWKPEWNTFLEATPDWWWENHRVYNGFEQYTDYEAQKWWFWEKNWNEKTAYYWD